MAIVTLGTLDTFRKMLDEIEKRQAQLKARPTWGQDNSLGWKLNNDHAILERFHHELTEHYEETFGQYTGDKHG